MFTLEQIKENRRKWVEALRSGKYRQVPDVLADGDGGFCCLGVLSDIAGCKWFKADELEHQTDDNHGSAAAGSKAMAFVGLAHSEGNFEDDGETRYLAELNDRGVPFAAIADIIEREPEDLFIPDAELAKGA